MDSGVGRDPKEPGDRDEPDVRVVPVVPVDLDLDAAGAGSGADTAIAAAFRTGLAPDEVQVRRVIAGLPDLQARARRGHRRRQGLASGAAALAVAATAVLVVSLSGSPRASVAPPAGEATATAAAPVRVSRASLLPAGAVTAFGDHRLASEPAPEDVGGEKVIAGVCVDGVVPGPAPVRGWQGGWRAVPGPLEDRMASLGLIEKIWQWDDTSSAAAVFDYLQAQVSDCAAGPGLEGRGITSRVEHATVDPGGAGRTLVTSASDGLGDQAVQVVMLIGDVVVQVDAVIPDEAKDQAGAAEVAWATLAPTARAALDQVQGQGEGSTR